jgi:eukaryotic-like serine/threonine-protein kinase
MREPSEVAAPNDALVGTVISGRYRVLERVASGGMSAVYRGEHVHMLKQVAIKVLDAKAERLPELVRRFRREAIAGAHVEHANIAKATDFGQLADGSYFLVLEYVAGTTLDKIIARGPLPVPRAVAIARQIALALQAAHAKSIVHRDLKPSNVMVVEGKGDLVKIIDFGLAQVRIDQVPGLSLPPGPHPSEADPLTVAGVVFGTVAYMAPEASLGMGAVDARSDLYALGIVLYQMVAGVHPFEATEPTELFLAQRTATPPAIGVRAPGKSVPEPLEALIMRLCEKDPASRYQTGTDVVEALDGVMLGLAFEGAEYTASVVAAPAPFGAPPDEASEAATRIMPPPTLADLGALRSRLPGHLPIVAGAGAVLLALAALLAVVVARRHPGRAVPAAVLSVEPALPVAVPEATATAPEKADVAGSAERLRAAARAKDWALGTPLALSLMKSDPSALREHRTQAAMVACLVGQYQNDIDAGDKLLESLAADLDVPGLDALYDIVRWRWGTKAAARAKAILHRPDVLSRAPAELRLLIDLMDAPCAAKRGMFARAASEGDARALHELSILRDRACNRWRDPCCFKDNGDLARAVAALRAKEKQP